MRIAVSIPDELVETADRLARRMMKSRSQLFSDAIKEYVARHATEDVIDEVDPFVSVAAQRILARSEW